jgi:hypothetical protein
MDFEAFEALRTNLATEIRKAERAGDGNASMALSIIRDSLEALPLTGEAAALKPLADAARTAARERFEALKRDPAYKAAVDDKIAPENFVETFVLSKGKGTEKNVQTMMDALGKGTDGQYAVAANIIDYLTNKTNVPVNLFTTIIDYIVLNIQNSITGSLSQKYNFVNFNYIRNGYDVTMILYNVYFNFSSDFGMCFESIHSHYRVFNYRKYKT